MSTTLIVVASATPASILGALALWLPAKWARDAAAAYRSEADRTFDAATSLADEVERTRNLPWYWPTGPAIEPAPAEPEPEVAADDAVTGEVLAIDGVDTETDAPHEDTDRPRWWATVVAFVVLAPLAFARRQLPVLVEWLAYRLKSQDQRDAEFAETYHRALEQARDASIIDAVVSLRSSGHSDEDVVAELKDLFGLGTEPWTLYDEDELRANGMGEVEILLLREGIVLVPTEPAAELEAPAEIPTPVDEEPSEVEERALLDTAWAAANPPTNPTYKSHRCPSGAVSSGDRGYLSRHTHPDFQTGVFPVINPSIPAQRDGGDDL